MGRPLRVFVASAGDVQQERDRAHEVVAKLNRTLGTTRGIAIQLWDWRRDATPGMGHPQDLINPALDEADLVVAIFWNRFGAGTQEEILRAIDRWREHRRPDLLAYFCQRPTPRDPRLRASADEVDALKTALEDDAVCLLGTYDDADDFEGVLHEQLYRAIERMMGAPGEGEKDATDLAARRATGLLDTYLHWVERRHRHFRLLGFGEQLDVRMGIDQAYVPLRARLHAGLEAERIAGRFKEDPENEGPYERDIELTDAFRHADSRGLRGVALLGDPGAGKTTVARRLSWQVASARLGPTTLGLPDATIPALLRLRRLYARGLPDSLEEFVRQEVRSWCEVEDGSGPGADGTELAEVLWRHEHVLWIFDGLDEVADLETRRTVSRWIEGLLDAREEHRILVTCRYAGYQDGERDNDPPVGGHVRLDGATFLELEVRPLDESQQHDFVSRWYCAVEKRIAGVEEGAEEAERRAADLARVLQGPDFRGLRLASLASNPLLLSVLCLVHRKDVDLPRRRFELFDRCLAVLLEHWKHAWRKELGVTALDVGVARAILQPLAWWMHQEEGRTEADAVELTAQARGVISTLRAANQLGAVDAAFLQRIRDESGLLVTPVPGRFQFLHLSFQEHLAAAHFVETGQARELAHCFGQSWWDEVTLLALSRAPEGFAETYFAALLEQTGPLGDLLPLVLNETLHIPLGSFADALASPDAGRRRELLQCLAPLALTDESLVERARSLAVDPDAATASAARELLLRAGTAPPEPRATGQSRGPREERLDERTGIILVSIPSGSFLMGSEGGESRESPVHRVSVPSFWIAKHPVTNAQYQRFLDANPDQGQPAVWSDSRWNRPEQPIVGVSWDQARAFCEWASLRLPSEAEWEYACRACESAAYSFGDEESRLDEFAWYLKNSDGVTHPVGRKEPNAWGLHDIHGNVWEWCEDQWHGSYEGAPQDGRAWIEEQAKGESVFRVLRGGSWYEYGGWCRSAFRVRWSQGVRYADLGFRPARSSPPGDVATS